MMNPNFEDQIQSCENRLYAAMLASNVTFLRGTYLGNDFAGDFCYLRVWRQAENLWQVVGGSVSAIAV